MVRGERSQITTDVFTKQAPRAFKVLAAGTEAVLSFDIHLPVEHRSSAEHSGLDWTDRVWELIFTQEASVVGYCSSRCVRRRTRTPVLRE